MVWRPVIIVLLAFVLVASCRPLVLDDSSVKQYCPTFCWSKSAHGDKARAERCPTTQYTACTRQSSDGTNYVGGYTCTCGRNTPTTDPPSTTPPAVPGTTAPPMTAPTVPPNFPGNALYGTPTAEGPIACGTTVLSGHKTVSSFSVNIGKTAGVDAVVDLGWEFYEIPDSIVATYEGKEVLSTGVVRYDGEKRLGLKGSSSILQVKVYSPDPLTAWDFSVTCA